MADSSTTNPPKNKSTPKAKSPKAKPKHKVTKYDVVFTIFVLVWAMLVTAASQYLVSFLLYWILGEKILEPGWTLLYYILTYLIALSALILLPPALIKKYRSSHKGELNEAVMDKVATDMESTPNSMGVQHLPTFIDIGLAPIGYVISRFIAIVLVSMMSAFTWFNINQTQDIGFGYYITDLDRIFAMLATIVVAPIAEELIMRGWLYGKVRRKWNAPIAIILVSLVFAVLHGQWNVGVSVFALSIVLCTLREITGTIWSGMILHMLSNAIAFYILYIAI